MEILKGARRKKKGGRENVTFFVHMNYSNMDESNMWNKAGSSSL
jgi:hypothetical protein